jgi:hypothetical protein
MVKRILERLFPIKEISPFGRYLLRCGAVQRPLTKSEREKLGKFVFVQFK